MKLSALALPLFLALASSGLAQGIPEPSVVLYGKVVQIAAGSSFQLFEGTLEMTFVNESNPANVVALRTSLGPVGEGGAFSYALDIPQKYLPRTLELGEVLSTGARPTSFRFGKLTVNGFDAPPLDGTVDAITTSFQQRAQQIRLDLRVGLPEADNDGDGLPDWWENQYGLNPNFPDAAADKDGDGRTNAQEYRDGTDPGRSNSRPLLRTARVRVPERGRAGLLLNVLDSDSTPSQLSVTVKSIGAGFALQRNGQNLSSNAVFTLADVAAGQVVLLHQDPAIVTGSLTLEIKDPTNPALTSGIEVLVFQPSLADGTDATLWLDASRIGAADKTRLAEWRDRSGRNNHAWQPATGQRPEFVANAGGKPAVDFAGSQRHLLLEDKALPLTDTTFFAVYDAPRTGGPETVLAANRLALSIERHSGNVPYPGSQTFLKDDRQVGGRYKVRDRRVVSSVEFAGGRGVAFANERFDGIAQPLATAASPVEPALGVRRRPAASESERFEGDFEGRIRELLAFPEKLDASRRRRITDYLESKWQNATLWDWSDEGSPVTVQGGSARNIIRGGWGADVLRGGAADDLIAGGPGDDTLGGGNGSDTFSYTLADTGRDVILDFVAVGITGDVLDLSELFVGKTGDPREYLALRSEAVRVGDNLVGRSVLSVKLDPADRTAHQEIVLEGLALNNADLGRLIGEGIILTGDLVIPVTVSIEEGKALAGSASSEATIRVARAGNLGSSLEVPLALASSESGEAAFALAGLGGDDTRQVVRFAAGETEKILSVVPRTGTLALAGQRARIEVLPQAQFTIGQGSVEVLLEGTTAADAYAAWAATRFPSGIDAAAAASGADFDGDGAGNLAEYLFGSDPTRADSTPRALEITREAGRLVLSIDTASEHDGARFVLWHRPSVASAEVDVTSRFVHTRNREADGRIRHAFELESNALPATAAGFFRVQLFVGEGGN